MSGETVQTDLAYGHVHCPICHEPLMVMVDKLRGRYFQCNNPACGSATLDRRPVYSLPKIILEVIDDDARREREI